MLAPLRRLFVVLLCAVAAAVAQAPLSVHGTLTDPTGAAVPGAKVRILSRQGRTLAETFSDSKGAFTLPNLSAGDVQLVVPSASGFATRNLSLHLTASVAALTVRLTPATASDSVDVSADEPRSTESAANKDTVAISGDALRKLPVFDQNYIAALTPFLDASSGSSGGATIIVDGVEMKSSGVSASAIQEVRINNDPYSAEFNRPGRGRIEIITKPGSPQFHGELNLTFRDAIFNARNFFAPVRPPEQRRIAEGHVTGPVGHGGHTTFILSGSRSESDLQAAVNAVTATGVVNANAPVSSRFFETALRVTRDRSDAHRVSLQYNVEIFTNRDDNVGGQTLPEAGQSHYSREDDLVFNDRFLVTPSLINQLQITLEKDEDNTSSDTEAPAIEVSGGFIGGGAQADAHRTENTLHANEVVSWSHGRHYLRFGAQLPQVSKRAVDDHSDRLGTFSFASLAAYAANTPYSFTAQQGPGRGLYWINEVGAFVQDQVKFSPRFQMSFGLRYDWQTYIDDTNNLAPRISAAYAPGKGRTILRIGTGVFYDRTGGDFPATVKLHNGVVLRSVQLLNPTYPNPYPAGFDIASLPTSLVRFDPHARAPYTIQSSFGVERQIGKAASFAATYRNGVQVKSFRSRDVNAPILPPNPSLTANYPRPDPRYAQIQQIESGGRQFVNALDLNFHGTLGRWFSGQAQYTLARFRNRNNSIYNFPADQYNPNADWARAIFDRLHKFDLLATVNPDHWLSVGIAAALYSGTPYNEIAGNDFFHTGLGNARPPGVGRNTLQAGGTATVDLLWSHDLRLTSATGDKAKVLSFGVSAFNVLNHTNYLGYVGNVTSPLFRQPTAARSSRQMQFSLGFRF